MSPCRYTTVQGIKKGASKVVFWYQEMNKLVLKSSKVSCQVNFWLYEVMNSDTFPWFRDNSQQ